MLRFEYFETFKHWSCWIVDVRGNAKTVLFRSMTKHETMRDAIRECERVRGKNVEIPIELIVKDSR